MLLEDLAWVFFLWEGSKHLRLMKDAGIVECRRQGIWRYYRVIDPEIQVFCPHPERLIQSM